MISGRHFTRIAFITGLILAYYLGYLRGSGILTEMQLRALLIFIATYFLIATEVRQENVVTLSAIVMIWLLGIMEPKDMVRYVDLQTLGILFGMMVVVGALQEAGFYDYIGYRIRSSLGGQPDMAFWAIIFLTYLLSAFLPNITAVMFTVPLLFSTCKMYGEDPPFMLTAMIIAANAGGFATLVGDPPNMMIASKTGFTFRDFMLNTFPISVVSMIGSIFFLKFIYGRFVRREEAFPQISEEEEEEFQIKDRRFFYLSLAAFLASMIAFTISDKLGLTPAEVALFTAVFLMAVGGEKMSRILENVQWDILLFVASIFVVVGALEYTGLLKLVSSAILPLLEANPQLSISLILWIAALGSAVIPNIPFAAVMTPLLAGITPHLSPNVSNALWWSLATGLALGGNFTPISAAPNVVALSIAERYGIRMNFKEFMRIALPPALVAVTTANLYLVAAY